MSGLELDAKTVDEVGQDEFDESKVLSSCSSCKDEGKTVAAVRYCVDCEEYQCNKCFKSHDRYNKEHEVYDASCRHKWGTKKQVKLPTERCPTHVGEVLQLFCEDHDAVCCHVCIAMKHSTCPRKHYIPEVAKNITKENEEFVTLKDTIDKIQKHIEIVIDDSKQNKESIRISREKFQSKMEETRQKFEAFYKQLQQNSNFALGHLHDIIDAEAEATIKSSNALLAEVKGLRERVNPDTCTNESQLYINMKQVKGEIEGMIKKVSIVSQPQSSGYECQTNPEVDRFLKKTEGLLSSKPTRSQGTTNRLSHIQKESGRVSMHQRQGFGQNLHQHQGSQVGKLFGQRKDLGSRN